jgi:hypothetical protein
VKEAVREIELRLRRIFGLSEGRDGEKKERCEDDSGDCPKGA